MIANITKWLIYFRRQLYFIFKNTIPTNILLSPITNALSISFDFAVVY